VVVKGKTMFRLWSEWDIGEKNVVFTSREVGMRWLHANEAIKEMAAEESYDDIPSFVEGLFADCYLDWEAVEVIQ
jgi:hypothetical protein